MADNVPDDDADTNELRAIKDMLDRGFTVQQLLPLYSDDAS